MSSAEALVAAGPQPDPEAEVVEPTEEVTPEVPVAVEDGEVVAVEDVVVEPEATEEETNEEEDDDEKEELPAAIKDILKKNRQITREAEARAVAAERELEELKTAPADTQFKTLYLNQKASLALTNAGFSTGTDRFMKLVDFDSISVDEKGNVSGLDEQIEALKEDFKELIEGKPAVRKVTATVDGAGHRSTPSVPKTSAERLAESMGRKK